MGQGPPGTHRHTPHCLVSEPMGYLYRRRPHQKPGQKLATVLTTPFYQDPHHLAVGHLVFHTTYGLLVMAWPGRHPATRQPPPAAESPPGPRLPIQPGLSTRDQGSPPIWVTSHRPVGTMSAPQRKQPLRSRLYTLRTFWDLRWHGENRAVAAHSSDPQVSACPIYHQFWSQAHVFCECPSTTDARLEGQLDLTIALGHLPLGPTHDLGHQFRTLLSDHNHPQLLARRWAGHWDMTALGSLRPLIARCSRKQIKAVLGHIGRITQSTTSACWRQFAAMARELNPPPAAPPPPLPLETHMMSTIDWDPRLGEDHG